MFRVTTADRSQMSALPCFQQADPSGESCRATARQSERSHQVAVLRLAHPAQGLPRDHRSLSLGSGLAVASLSPWHLRLSFDAVAGVARRSAASTAAVAGSSIRSGSPCRDRERRVLSVGLADGGAFLVAHRHRGGPLVFPAGGWRALRPVCLGALRVTLCGCLSVCLSGHVCAFTCRRARGAR
jgi:hypothetical protein